MSPDVGSRASPEGKAGVIVKSSVIMGVPAAVAGDDDEVRASVFPVPAKTWEDRVGAWLTDSPIA